MIICSGPNDTPNMNMFYEFHKDDLVQKEFFFNFVMISYYPYLGHFLSFIKALGIFREF